jgi:hypothetical protein
MMKRDGGLSLAQEHRRVRESSGARGNGEGCSRGAGRGGGLELTFSKGRESAGEAAMGSNGCSNGLNAIDS